MGQLALSGSPGGTLVVTGQWVRLGSTQVPGTICTNPGFETTF